MLPLEGWSWAFFTDGGRYKNLVRNSCIAAGLQVGKI